MTTLFTKRFSKDLDKILISAILSNISDEIEQVGKASFLSEIKNLKKLKGFANAYRI